MIRIWSRDLSQINSDRYTYKIFTGYSDYNEQYLNAGITAASLKSRARITRRTLLGIAVLQRYEARMATATQRSRAMIGIVWANAIKAGTRKAITVLMCISESHYWEWRIKTWCRPAYYKNVLNTCYHFLSIAYYWTPILANNLRAEMTNRRLMSQTEDECYFWITESQSMSILLYILLNPRYM